MGLFSRNKSKEDRSFFPYIENMWSSGVFPSERNPAVDNAVSKIANTISILPIHVYTQTSKGKVEVFWDPVYQLIKNPAVEESAELFYKTLVRHIFLNGNVYIFKHKHNGEVLSLELIDPSTVIVRRSESGRKLFDITGERGGVYTDKDIIHIPYTGEGYNGTLGKSPCEIHKNLIQKNDIISEYISIFFNNGLNSRLLVTLGEKYEPGSAKMQKLVQEFNEYFQKFILGQKNTGRPVITPPGTTLSMLEMGSNVETDVLKLYDQSNAEIYRIFNIPPEILISSENKYNSLSQKQQDFLVSCIQPLTLHIGQCLVKGLVEPEYQGVTTISFDYSAMIETDPSSKADYQLKLFHGGAITLNELRQSLNMGSVENEVEGSTRWLPANLIPLTEGNIEAILAKSKNELNKLENLDGHNPIGDDKE